MQRPTSVTVIGWVFVGTGLMIALGGLFGAAMSLVAPMPRPDPSAFSSAPAPFRFFASLTDHFALLVAAQLSVALIMIVSGSALLRLRSWSRPILEFLSWLGLLYVLGFCAFWIWAVYSMGLHQSSSAEGPGAAFFWVFMAFGLLMSLAFAIPPVLLIRALRGSTVRNALLQASA